MKNLDKLHLALVSALLGVAVGCGAGDSAGADPTVAAATNETDVEATSDALAGCPSSTHQLVCGTDGRTHTNICRAGGINRVAHVGACPGFVCNGVVCVSGFTCRTSNNFGVTLDQCVSDTGAPPACACATGAECIQEPSGATRCETAAAPLAAPNPSSLCEGKTCPPGLHCEVTTINFGVPAPSCMYD